MKAAAEPTFPPPERGQHDAIEHVKDGPTGSEVYRLAEPSQIERYYRQQRLGRLGKEHGAEAEQAAEMLAAGLEYARCAYVGCLGPRYTKLNLHRIAGAPSDGLAQQEAVEKIRDADRALGNTHASFVWAVCVEGWTANAWAKERARQHGWGEPDSRFGMALLLDALRILAAHWGSG